MERNEYLRRLQTALYDLAYRGLKESDYVVHDGVKYYPYEYVLTYDGGKCEWVHLAVLHSTVANSVRVVKLSEVKEAV